VVKSFYEGIINKMLVGYALHKIIFDGNRLPCDYEYIEINDAFEAFLGIPRSKIIGKRVTEILPEFQEDEFEWLKRYGEVAKLGSEMKFEQYSQLKGKWSRIQVFSYQIEYLITLEIDITQEKSDMERLVKNEEKWKSYIESAPCGVFIADRKGRYQEVNPEACRITGYTNEELTQMTIRDLLPGENVQAGLDHFETLVSEGHAEMYENKFRTKKGEVRWWSVAASRINEDRFIGYCHDITVKKMLEEEIKKNEELYRVFIDASQDMIYLKDENYNHIMANKALASFYGKSISEIIAKSDFELMTSDAAEQCRKNDMEALLRNKPVIFEEKIAEKVYETVKFPVPIGIEKVGVGGYIRDITQAREHQEKLIRISARERIIKESLLRSFENKEEQLYFVMHEWLKETGDLYGFIYINEKLIPVTKDNGKVDKQTTDKFEKIIRKFIKEKSPILINDLEQTNLRIKVNQKEEIPIKRFISIPIIIEGKTVTVVGLMNKSTDYDFSDIYETTMLMNGVWMAVEKSEAQQKTSALLKQTQTMFNDHETVMLIIEPHTGEIRDANPAAVDYYGYSRNELLTMRIQDINTMDKNEVALLRLKALEKKQKFFTMPHRLRNGEIREVDVYSCPISYMGEIMLYSIIFDVTEREKAYEEIKYLSYHDHLTGLYNRRFFKEELNLLDVPENLPMTIIIADVNGLKTVNDNFGYKEGDLVLKTAADTLRQACRKDDIVSRIGGDEFGIILPKTGEKESIQIIERIKTNLKSNDDNLFQCSISLGYQIKYIGENNIEEVLTDAENYMYRNKMYESLSIRNQSVSLVMNALFAKSKREMEHSSRVSKFAEKISSAMGLSDEAVNQVRIAGLLHDIGKIGIAERILNKPGKLDEEEWEKMKKHSRIGWRILESIDEFRELADIILYHHERWDGKGYPKGIKAEEAPLPSRILAVADAYDAMTKDRTYRKAMTKAEAMAELQKNAGSQFDPVVVQAFISNKEYLEDPEVLPRNSDNTFIAGDCLPVLEKLI